MSVFSYITFGTKISGLMFIFLSRELFCECIFLYHIWDHNIRFNFIFLNKELLCECLFLYHTWDHNIRFDVYFPFQRATL